MFFLCFNLVSCGEDKELWHQSNSAIDVESESVEYADTKYERCKYVLNTNSKKIHKTTCGTGDLILPENRAIFEGDIDELYDRGYTKCGNCFK